MSLPVVHLTSDSDCSSSDDENNANDNFNHSSMKTSYTNSSHSQRSDFQNVQMTHSYTIQSDVIKDPLFKIIFRDELTSRKYRQRLEDIIKFVLMNQVDDDNQNKSSLVLDIYDPLLETTSTSHAQHVQNATKVTPKMPTKSDNFYKQDMHNNIVYSNTKKKLKHKRNSQQSDTSVPQNPATSKTQEISNTLLDIQVKQEVIENITPIESKMLLNNKNRLKNNQQLLQTNIPPTQITLSALGSQSSIPELAEITTNNIRIKEESQSTTSSSNKSFNDNQQLQGNDNECTHIQTQMEISATPLMQEDQHNSTNNSISLQTDIKSNSNFINTDKFSEFSEQPYCKQELQNNASSAKILKHKLINVDDSYQSKKLKTDNEPVDILYTDINEEILDEKNYSDLTNNLETYFEDSTVKIGSYKYFNRDRSIFLSKDGLTFVVPTPNHGGKNPKIISIELDDILKILVHFKSTNPALFFFITTKTAIYIREILKMNDPNGPYFDPNSLDLKHQHIAILPKEICDQSQSIIMELFKNKEIVEIEAQVADDLSNLATTVEDNLVHIKLPKSVKGINDKTSNASVLCNYGTTYLCHIIRVGSLEYSKKRVFIITSTGIKFCVPHLKNASFIVTLNVNIVDVNKVEIFFSKKIPMLFFYINEKAAEIIRNSLGMTDPSGPFFDICGNETQNKIIILPQTLSERCYALREWFLQGKVEKLEKGSANLIFSKSFKRQPRRTYMTRSKTQNNLQTNNETTMNTLGTFDNNSDTVHTTEKNDNTEHCTSNLKRTNPDHVLNETNASDDEEETTEIISSTCISIKADFIKIGSYKYKKRQATVIISTEGLNFDLPKINDNANHKVLIHVKLIDITKIWFFFSNTNCYLFFVTTSACAQQISSILEMYDKKKTAQFNPLSESLQHKRIVIIFRQSNFKYRSILKNILNKEMIKIPTHKTVRQMLKNKM